MYNDTDLHGLADTVTVPMPTAYGDFSMTVVTDPQGGKEHILMVMGQPDYDSEPIVRIHSECAHLFDVE